MDELYTKGELLDLEKEFGVAVNEREVISRLSLEAILQNMGILLDHEDLVGYISMLKPEYKEDEVDLSLIHI